MGRLSLVVALLGAVLVASGPPRAADPVCDIQHRTADQSGEQVMDFVAGQRDPFGGRRLGDSFDRSHNGEEGVGEHRHDRPAVPGGPVSDLVLVKAVQLVETVRRRYLRRCRAARARLRLRQRPVPAVLRR